MTPNLRDILKLLENVAPTELAEPWDNPGLQVGSYSQKIKKIFLALDPSLKSVKTAVKHNAQLLLAHHPLIFKPLSRFDINAFPGNVILEAIKNKISVIAAHTNLDASQGGINDILADLLGLQNVAVLKEINGIEGVGLGRIGNLAKSVSLSVIANDIKRILNVERLKVAGRRDAPVHRIAVLGGSGGSLVSLAAEKGAQLLLTGDVGHHQALEAQSLGIALIDGGHFQTEIIPLRIFARHLQAMVSTRGWDVSVEVDHDETDPMRYS